MLKRMMAGVLATAFFMSAAPMYIMAEPASGSAVEYDYYEDDVDDDDTGSRAYYDDDDEDETPVRRSENNRNSDEDRDTSRRSDDPKFIYSEETTTEPTTVAIIVDQSGISTPDGITANINISAEGAALLDIKTGTLLYGKHADDKMYPASMTKVMTVLLACENGKLDDMVTVSENAVNNIPWDSSNAGLVAGEEMTLSDLLYCVNLVSGNDAAVAVAEHIAGSEAAFVEMMNKRAAELGCENTHFMNPHGYHDENHYTTPHDMALIVMAASQNENVKQIWGSPDHSIKATNKHEARVLNHSDKMLQPTTAFYDERVKGGKTGFHNQAMNTLASYAVNGEAELAVVVMRDKGYDPTYADTKILLDYGFDLYKERKLYGRDRFERILPVVQIYNGEEIDLGTVNVTLAGDLTAVTPSFINEDSVAVSYDMPERLEAPINAGETVGTVTISYGDSVLGTLDIVPETTVEAIPESKLASERRTKALLGVIKAIGIAVVVIILLLTAVVFGLRAWFISQRKRKNMKPKGHNTSNADNKTTKKKKKIKIKFK